MQEYQNHIISLGVIPQTPPPTYKHITTRQARQSRVTSGQARVITCNNASTSSENNQPPAYAEISSQQGPANAQSVMDCSNSNNVDTNSTTDQSDNEPGGVDNPSYSADEEESITSNQTESHATLGAGGANQNQSGRPSSPSSFYEGLGEVTHL